MSELKARINTAMKEAMKARDKDRLGAIRLMMSEFKRIEVDERVELDDARVLAILDKMLKQRRDSVAQYEAAGREDLASIERAEMLVIGEYLPEALSDDEISTLISAAVTASGAASVRDMGAVMAILKPQIQGRADVAQVSQKVKAALG